MLLSNKIKWSDQNICGYVCVLGKGWEKVGHLNWSNWDFQCTMNSSSQYWCSIVFHLIHWCASLRFISLPLSISIYSISKFCYSADALINLHWDGGGNIFSILFDWTTKWTNKRMKCVVMSFSLSLSPIWNKSYNWCIHFGQTKMTIITLKRNKANWVSKTESPNASLWVTCVGVENWNERIESIVSFNTFSLLYNKI